MMKFGAAAIAAGIACPRASLAADSKMAHPHERKSLYPAALDHRAGSSMRKCSRHSCCL
jgi:hypothetical protein